MTVAELSATMDPSRAVCGQFRALMAGGFTAAARVTPAFAALQRMMGPAAERATADPASRAAAVTLFIEATQPLEGLEPYVTSATAGVEIARRCLDTPAVRFRPPFVNSWRLSYPELAAALPRVCTGDTVIDTLRSLAVEFKIPNDFDSVCYGQGCHQSGETSSAILGLGGAKRPLMSQ